MAAAARPAGPEPFPWDEAMEAGLARLRLSPRDFWAMTPREFVAALGRTRRAAHAPDRAALTDLMARFPDGPTTGEDDGHG